MNPRAEFSKSAFADCTRSQSLKRDFVSGARDFNLGANGVKATAMAWLWIPAFAGMTVGYKIFQEYNSGASGE
jgi:hypothetical protein